MASAPIFRHTPDADRAQRGAARMAPMGNFAWLPHAHFGVRLTRIALHGELHLRPQWARSRGGHPLHADRAPQGADRAYASKLCSGPLFGLPRGAQYMKTEPRPARHAAA